VSLAHNRDVGAQLSGDVARHRRPLARLGVMAFGQRSGPPATNRQLTTLTELLQAAGFASFREARHTFGLTQQQAAGKFSRDEADALIAELDTTDTPWTVTTEPPPPPSAPEPEPQPARPKAPRRSLDTADRLRSVPSDVLAAELQRRGWAVMEP
jgi:hypothetical protein